MKVKEEANELAALVSASTMSSSSISDDIDDTPEELEPEPLFDIDYKKCKKGFVKKAKNSIIKIVRAVIRDSKDVDLQFLMDKIEQDAENLAQLYYQQKLCELIQQANVESVRTGNISPRMIEVFTNLSTKITDTQQQIAQFQISIKENYAKIKFDAMEEAELPIASESPEQPQELTDKHIFMGGSNIIDSIADARRKLIEQAEYKTVEDSSNDK